MLLVCQGSCIQHSCKCINLKKELGIGNHFIVWCQAIAIASAGKAMEILRGKESQNTKFLWERMKVKVNFHKGIGWAAGVRGGGEGGGKKLSVEGV